MRHPGYYEKNKKLAMCNYQSVVSITIQYEQSVNKVKTLVNIEKKRNVWKVISALCTKICKVQTVVRW